MAEAPADPARLDAARLDAARRAVDLVRSGMVLGLGTGATASAAVREIGRRLADGRLSDITGVPTSNATRELARETGVPLTDLAAHPRVDLAIDGADEVDPAGNLIKGLGGALLNEKLVAVNARRLVIVVDETKLVRQLGERVPLPIEVVPFGWTTHLDFLRGLGATPKLRTAGGEDTPFVTDGGHYIVDARFPGGIPDPHMLAEVLARRPGIVETGLFLGMALEVLVGRGT
ncbi:MAG: ribose 5-phosphate isomerase A [Gemmatimonadota bacterium]|nr:ribose 5-phosphate isomerase A [Gemmatimonadota bacterium]